MIFENIIDRLVKAKCPKRTIPKEKNCDVALLSCINGLPSNPRNWKPPARDPYKAEAFRRYANEWFGKEKWKDKCPKKCP